MSSEPEAALQRHPKNIPGPFYVLDFCIHCGVPELEAPELLDHDRQGCFFQRQPETPEELEHAIEALLVSCCGNHGYAGDNPEIIKRLREKRVEDSRIGPGTDQRYQAVEQ